MTAIVAASSLASGALAQAAPTWHEFRPRYLPIYPTLQMVLTEGLPFIGTPGRIVHRRAAEPGEDVSAVVLQFFEKQCLEGFRRGREPTLTLSTAILDQALPRRDGRALVRSGQVFCVPGAKDGPKIFQPMKNAYSVLDDQGYYAPREPFSCGAPYVAGGTREHAGVEAAFIGDVPDRQGALVPMSHCWASAQAGDYAVVLKGVETALQKYGQPYSRNPAVVDGDWVRQAAYEVNVDGGVLTVLVSGAVNVVPATGPRVEINMLPVRFTP